MNPLSDAEPIEIRLNPRLSDANRTLAVRYLRAPRSLTPQERLHALEIFDGLGASLITIGGRTATFAAFYRERIEGTHADTFIDQLLNADAPEAIGGHILRTTWQRIVSDLQVMGIQLSGDTGQQTLVVFCGYWWQSFARGYIREINVFRDLGRSGIEFVAHDIQRRQQRFSPFDLVVLGFRGDIKTSTYFLHTARSYPLVNDFYLVRLYDAARRAWLDIVMLKSAMWRAIDGDATPCELDEAARLLPMPLRVTTRGEELIVITYEEWKQRVLHVQSRAKGGAS